MTNSIRGIKKMEVIFIIGSNTKESHPVIANQMIKAYRNGAKIIIADPRKIPMTKFAHSHLQLKPGTDVVLTSSIAHVIVKEGLENIDFIGEKTEGFEEWKSSLDDFTPEYAEEITGVPADSIREAARLYAGSDKAGIFYTMGITQHSHGTDNVTTLANLALLTGNIGREYTGINPLRGQNNVQGACDVGGLPNVFPGYQKVSDPKVRKKFAKAWDCEIPEKPGLTATAMIDKALEGELKALYIMGENPVLSDPNSGHTVKALKNLDFLVVQDIFMTETAALADVVLPATSFAEKNGTFTNTERRVQLVRRAITPPGQAKPDIMIISEISQRLQMPMCYVSAEDVFLEIAELWEGVAGINYKRLEKKGIQWPCPTRDHPGTEILFTKGFPVGKPKFTKVEYRPSMELPDKDYPYLLTTGRNLFQYHTGSMTRRVPEIEAVAGKAYIEINAADAKELGVKDGQSIKVTSRRGEIDVPVRITDRVKAGVVFVPMHYAEAAANALTNNALDPVCSIPEYKVCAVKIAI
jgi:formate dehydrogenase major subunit/formate dehydrogenase alpha subunit